jgi:hypothetical protein
MKHKQIRNHNSLQNNDEVRLVVEEIVSDIDAACIMQYLALKDPRQ